MSYDNRRASDTERKGHACYYLASGRTLADDAREANNGRRIGRQAIRSSSRATAQVGQAPGPKRARAPGGDSSAWVDTMSRLLGEARRSVGFRGWLLSIIAGEPMICSHLVHPVFRFRAR